MEADISSCILATGGYDHQVRLWRVDNGSSYRTFQHADSVGPQRTPMAAVMVLSPLASQCADD